MSSNTLESRFSTRAPVLSVVNLSLASLFQHLLLNHLLSCSLNDSVHAATNNQIDDKHIHWELSCFHNIVKGRFVRIASFFQNFRPLIHLLEQHANHYEVGKTTTAPTDEAHAVICLWVTSHGAKAEECDKTKNGNSPPLHDVENVVTFGEISLSFSVIFELCTFVIGVIHIHVCIVGPPHAVVA